MKQEWNKVIVSASTDWGGEQTCEVLAEAAVYANTE